MKRILILTVDGKEKSELVETRNALAQAGAEPTIVSPFAGKIRACPPADNRWAIGKTPDCVDPNNFDALVIPVGEIDLDDRLLEYEAIRLVQSFARAGKPVAVTCNGARVLAKANVVEGRNVTCSPSIGGGMQAAGAQVLDQGIVTDCNIITSRSPDNVSGFSDAIIAALCRKPWQ